MIFEEKNIKHTQRHDEEIEKIEETANDNKESIEEQAKEIESLKADMDDIKNSDRGPDQQETIKGVMKEMKAIEERKFNLVVHGIQEPQADSRDERLNEERRKINEIFEKLNCRPGDDDIRHHHRIGKYKGIDHNRPLRIIYKKTESVENVLAKARTLKTLPAPYNEIQINRDLTQLQRDEEADMIITAKTRNDAMTVAESKNYKWRVVGRKGNKRLVKVALSTLQDDENVEAMDTGDASQGKEKRYRTGN